MLQARVGAHRVAYRDWGPRHAPPVVLVHGFVISHRYMLPLARRLARDFRVLLPDMPGFGRSSKPRDALDIDALAGVLAEWMPAVGLERAHVVGNSMGCQVAMALAQWDPHRVDRLALLGPTTDPAARSVPRQVGRLALDVLMERPSLPWLHVPDYARCGPRRIVQTLKHLMEDAIEERAPWVRAPTLVLRGGRDVLVSEAFARELAARLPAGEYAQLPGSPHAGNYSSPELASSAVTAFLSRERGLCEKQEGGARRLEGAWSATRSPGTKSFGVSTTS